MLALLSGLEAQGEVAVELGAAEVRELTEAEPDDPVGQRIREVKVSAVSHGVPPI
jgi:hypothetical protein